MSDTTTHAPSFAKLNNANYSKWAMRMEAHLICMKLWDGIVEITVDEKGRATDAVEEEEAKKTEKRSVQKMAEDLSDIHKARSLATQLAMKRRFLTAKKKKDQTVQAWIGQIQSMAFCMEETGLMAAAAISSEKLKTFGDHAKVRVPRQSGIGGNEDTGLFQQLQVYSNSLNPSIR
ncbi:hypothetical protein V8D89_015423 [Ganoderma adspersum]